MMQNPNYSNLPYRKGVNAFVIDNKNNYLLVQKRAYGENQWDFPGGGVEKGEDPKQAILRELEEELGTKSFKILGKSPIVNKFDWPEADILAHYKKKGEWFKGQEKSQYLIKFDGKKSDIKIQKEELRAVKWVSYDDLPKYLVFTGQWDLAKKTIDSFVSTGELTLV